MAFLRRLYPFLGAALIVVLVASARAAAADDAQDLAQAVQRRYAATRDFSADFVHTYTGGVLRKQLTERGRVRILKPGRMRWDYTAPEEKVFVSDGSKIYSYIPADKQVIVSSVPPDGGSSTPALFLAGRGDITRDFTATLAETPADVPAGSRALKLVPRTAQREYDWLILAVDPATFAIRGIVTVDAQGGKSSISFANLKENTGLADKDFAFKMPRGVDVVTDGSRR